jgi:hypothetical protein
LTVTWAIFPSRQRSRWRFPFPALDSAAVSAWPKATRGSDENFSSPIPRITSPFSSTPAAGEFSATSVMYIWRACLVSSLCEYIQPRAPVAPRVQSLSAPSGIGSPFVKSGFGMSFFRAADAGSEVARTIRMMRVKVERRGSNRCIVWINYRSAEPMQCDITELAEISPSRSCASARRARTAPSPDSYSGRHPQACYRVSGGGAARAGNALPKR